MTAANFRFDNQFLGSCYNTHIGIPSRVSNNLGLYFDDQFLNFGHSTLTVTPSKISNNLKFYFDDQILYSHSANPLVVEVPALMIGLEFTAPDCRMHFTTDNEDG